MIIDVAQWKRVTRDLPQSYTSGPSHSSIYLFISISLKLFTEYEAKFATKTGKKKKIKILQTLNTILYSNRHYTVIPTALNKPYNNRDVFMERDLCSVETFIIVENVKSVVQRNNAGTRRWWLPSHDAYLPPNSTDLHPLHVTDDSAVRVYSFAIFTMQNGTFSRPSSSKTKPICPTVAQNE